MEQAEVLKDLLSQLRYFLSGEKRNTFLLAGPVQVYVRKSIRILGVTDAERKSNFAVDIASIEVAPIEQKKGLGSAVINMIHDNNPCPVTYIESVVNPEFARSLEKQGWLTAAGSNELAPHFFKNTGRHGQHGGVLAMMARMRNQE